MPRPYTDIAVIKNYEPIKNNTIICSTTPTGNYNTYNYYVTNNPTINEIYNKYGNRFYNGIFVQLVSSQTLVGG